MADKEFVPGDKITLTRAPDGWDVQLLVWKGGVVGAGRHATAAEALAAIRDAAGKTKR